jgi:hypothetical protein
VSDVSWSKDETVENRTTLQKDFGYYGISGFGNDDTEQR